MIVLFGRPNVVLVGMIGGYNDELGHLDRIYGLVSISSVQAKLFMNGQSQAVRLPKQFRFEGKTVSIQKVGDSVVLSPVKDTWESFLEAAADFSADFMAEREQGAQLDRKGFEFSAEDE